VILTGGQLASILLEGRDPVVLVIQERYDLRGRREIVTAEVESEMRTVNGQAVPVPFEWQATP
jgi:hypothetical protein